MNNFTPAVTPGATAFSYIRFSRIQQKKGRSLDRQMEACEAWCVKHGVVLSEDRFLDEGKSGYSGEHLGPKGQLRRFVDLIEAGKIAKGSYLVIESIDRLSRQGVDEALERFMSILNAGVSIVTLMDNEKVYRTGANNAADLIMSILIMARANEESATKAKRSKDNWAAAFAKARSPERKPVGKQVAMWLRLVEVERDGKKVKEYQPDPVHEATIKRIFAECIAGHGFIAISKHLNADNTPGFRSDSWGSSSVNDVLENRCVLGEWTPKDGGGTIEGYFPQIITPETWGLAQIAMAKRRKGDYTRQTTNFQVWQQVGYCAVCGSSMNLIQKGPEERHKYLMCSRKRRGLCKEAVNVRYDKSQDVFKELLVKVGALGLIQTEAAAITDEMALIDAATHTQETILTRHMQAAAEINASPMIYRLITNTEQEIERLKGIRAELDAKHAAQTIAQSDKTWLLANLPLKERDDRQRANALLCRLGVTVDISGGNAPSYMAMQYGKRLVQFIVTDDEIVPIPFTDDQRQTFKDQDADGSDLAKVNALLNRQRLPKAKKKVRDAISKS